MKMKKVAIAVSALAALTVSASAFAQSTATIPATAEPGTIITYDAHNNAQIKNFEFKENSDPVAQPASESAKVSNGPAYEKENAIVAQVKEEAKSLPVFKVPDPVLPAPQPGMIVYYDGMGLPTKVVDAQGKTIGLSKWTPPKNGTYEWKSNKLTITDKYVLGEGNVTWYDGVGQTGADNKKLTNDNCATKMDYDRPPYNTEIRVRNLDNDKVANVYKADVGSLPNAVLDIMPDKMSKDFGAKVDKKKNTGRFNGRTYYEK